MGIISNVQFSFQRNNGITGIKADRIVLSSILGFKALVSCSVTCIPSDNLLARNREQVTDLFLSMTAASCSPPTSHEMLIP